MSDITPPPNAQGKRAIMATPQQIEILEKLNAAGANGRVEVISEKEMEVLNKLRGVDFYRAGRQRVATIHFNGSRALVFIGEQA